MQYIQHADGECDCQTATEKKDDLIGVHMGLDMPKAVGKKTPELFMTLAKPNLEISLACRTMLTMPSVAYHAAFRVVCSRRRYHI